MAEARNHAKIEFGATITLNEVEIRALNTFTLWGIDAFLSTFKEKLGSSDITKHEAGVRSLFKTIHEQVGPALRDIETARRDLHNAMVARAQAAEQQRVNAMAGKEPTP